jgi:hypothetical protein
MDNANHQQQWQINEVNYSPSQPALDYELYYNNFNIFILTLQKTKDFIN